MHEDRGDYEPIIATRRAPRPEREEVRPLWPVALALGAGLIVIVLLAWWFLGRRGDAPSTAQSEAPAAETFPEIRVEQTPTPPARDPEPVSDAANDEPRASREAEPTTDAVRDPAPPAPDSETPVDVAEAPAPQPGAEDPVAGADRAASPESSSEGAPGNAVPVPATPASVQVSLASPDAQVRFELRSEVASMPPVTGKAGDVVDVMPGTYRVVASGPQLEALERQVTFDAGGPQEYTVELCAERQRERESLAGQVIEERACTGAAECESMFMILGEEADQLVKDRDFRTQQCAKWRANAAPEGTWTLNTACDGASTCRIEIAQGVCTFAEPPRSARGTACPRAELR